MQRYRFYVVKNGITKYLTDWESYSYTSDRYKAEIFTEEEWNDWAEEEGYEREPIGEDEAMRLIGAPMLPGMEG